jgi:hypothetical protein
MTGRRTLYLPALIVVAVLMACAAALLAVSEKAEATFAGKPGKIAYSGAGATDSEIYTIKPGGGGRVQLTDDTTDDFEPSWGAATMTTSRGSSLCPIRRSARF